MEVPNIKDEIHRKATETLEYLATAAQQGRISEAEFSAGVDAVWMTAAGLAKKEFLTLIEDARELAEQADRSVSRVYRRGTNLAVMRWVPGGKEIEIMGPNGDRKARLVDHSQLPAEIERLEAMLQRQGFVRASATSV